MPDAEKVIEGLEMSYKYSNVDENNTLVPQWIVLHVIALLKEDERAIKHQSDHLDALLKAQEPRLVEPNDFENADDFNWLPAWCEERTGAGYWEMILPDALDEKDVRYWTGRPTDEQREAVKWE